MKEINTDFKYLFFIWGILTLSILFTYAHHGFFLIDCGREVYYPTQVLEGKILYKDIFNIYGPFSYMFNALLFKFFGINLNVLYWSGIFCTFLITSLTYLISRQFLQPFLSLSIVFFTIAIGVLNLNLFNFIFPYSYGMLYGIVAFLISFWLLIQYCRKSEKTLYLYLSCFFAGLCIASKYEFMPYFLVVLYSMIKVKSLHFKEYCFAIFSLIFMPLFCFGILFMQGLSLENLILTASILKTMAQSQTLKYFYFRQGVYFHKYTLLFLLGNFFEALISLSLFVYAFKTPKKIFSTLFLILSFILMICWVSPAFFAFLPILIVILAATRFKNLNQNILLTVLTLSAISISLKSFWGLATLNYGVFFVSFLTITLFALIFNIYDLKKVSQKDISIYLLVVSVILGYQNLLKLPSKNYPLKSNRGKIYTEKQFYISTDELIKYISSNTKKSDRILILPEGTFINFLTDRKSDDYYNSLIPLYIETFGEGKLIQHFKKEKPDYIIFNNWNTKDYYFKYICEDYALDFCSFVAKNYKQEKVIDSELRYLVFKKK